MSYFEADNHGSPPKLTEPGTQKDQENISIVVCYFDENYIVYQHLLVTATAKKGDVDTLTTTIADELTRARLSTDKILSQVYDGTSLTRTASVTNFI